MKIKLTKDQAKWLRDLLQNPVEVDLGVDKDQPKRIGVWESLNTAIKKKEMPR